MKFDNIEIYGENHASFFSKKSNIYEGTAAYLSPEVLNNCKVGAETDLWALGCIIYQMFTGISPFKERTEFLIFRKIMEKKICYPSTIPDKAISIIKGLLAYEPSQRLGAGRKGR